MDTFSSAGPYGNVVFSMFVNIDETGVLFESKPETTVQKIGAIAIPIHRSGSSDRGLTECIAVTTDGKDVPLFLILQGQSGGWV